MSHALKSPIHSDSLADVLERVLDKGVVIAGDVVVSLVGIELLSIRVRLLITTVDKAIEMGINWWEMDPNLSASARDAERALEGGAVGDGVVDPASPRALEASADPVLAGNVAALEDERRHLLAANRDLKGRLAMLERRLSRLEA